MPEFDDLAECYDVTRGGEPRGDQYAADLALFLPPGEPILEIGVGTGVVALGLKKRNRSMVGIDLSSPMLRRAYPRLGSVLARCDALQMSIGARTIAHAVSVWVVHAVNDPVSLFHEAARVLKPGGVYVVSPNQRPAPEDEIGRIISEMGARIDQHRGASRPRGVTSDEVLGWSEQAGFCGAVHTFERRWISAPSEELDAITKRAWPAMRELDEATIRQVTRPAVEALGQMPEGDHVRKAIVEVVVLEQA
ncbi:MAG: methyltransferase domain-containing protein [Acidimicrobiales bacterium]